MDEKRIDDQMPEEATPKAGDTSFVKRAGKRVWEAIRSLPGEFLNFWKSYPPKARKIAAIVAAVVLVAGVVGTLVFPDYTDCAFYIKDGELYLCRSNGDTMQITEKLFPKEMNSIFWERMSAGLHNFVQLSEDGKTLVYADHATLQASSSSAEIPYISSFDLYLRDLTVPQMPPVLIAEDVAWKEGRDMPFLLHSEDDLVIYHNQGTLYQYRWGKVTTIAENVFYYRFSEDEKTVLYLVTDGTSNRGTMFKKQGKDFPEKIASDVDWTTWYNEDMSAVAFHTEEGLYFKRDWNWGTVLAKNYVNVGAITGDNSLYYYTREEGEQGTLWDYIIDDWEGESYGDLSRDDIIAALKRIFVSTSRDNLWYYNGLWSSKVTDSVYAISMGYEKNSAESVFVYRDDSKEEPMKIKLSDIIAYCQERQSYNIEMRARDMLNEVSEQNGKYYACIGGISQKIDLDNIHKIKISEDGKAIYALANFDRKTETGDVYKIDIIAGIVGKPKLLGRDVKKGAWGILLGDVHIHMESKENQVTEVFMDGKKVTDNAFVWFTEDRVSISLQITKATIGYSNAKKMLYYLEHKDDGYDLIAFNGRQKKAIQENVYEFVQNGAGNLLIRGEEGLFFWNGRSLKKIDESAKTLIPMENFVWY